MNELVDILAAMSRIFPNQSVRVVSGFCADARSAALDNGDTFKRRKNETAAAFKKRVETAADRVGAITICFSR